MPTLPVKVNCPRCGWEIDLTVTASVQLVQTYPGRKAFITCLTSSSGTEHTCPETREY